jgi:uncharacterized membrane-anchored protein
MKTLPALAVLFFAAAFPARSAETPALPDPAARIAAARKLADGLKFQEGNIALRDGIARISLPAGFRYLDPADTNIVLSKLWGNPKGSGTLGMITPAAFDPLGGESWAVVLTFDEDGYVKDNDAAKINYQDLLKEMQDGTREASKAREKKGYSPIELVGWAAAPRYDAATHKMYWAKELKFGDEPENTLNYNIRMLGRRGVLVLNAVASMSQLKQVESATPELLRMVDFQEGHRYADFSASTDKVATYGLAALVAGGIAAKVGIFKGLWIAILAFKKVVVIGLIALGGYLKKLFAGKKDSGLHVPAVAAVPPSPPATG